MRLLIAALSLLTGSASAQGDLALDSLRAEDYHTAAESLRSGDLEGVDFRAARYAFALTDGYSPYAVDAKRRSRRVRDHLDAGDPAAAVVSVDSTLAENYVDLDAHYWALVAHDQLGDADRAAHHAAVFDGLIGSILDSDQGTEEDPFVVVNVTEEYVVLGILGLQQTGQTLVGCGDVRCDVQSVVDPEDGAELDLYFDISIPFGHMQRQLRAD